MPDLTPTSHRPHDRFFKLLLSDVSAARSLLQALPPTNLYHMLYLPGLQLEPASYVDESLQESFADLVYRCPYAGGEKALTITLLLEHKSYVPTYLHLQLLRYLLNLWEQDRREGHPLRLVLPIVIYHGPQPWEMPRFQASFPAPLPPDFEGFMPAFEPLLLNLRAMSDEALLSRVEHGFLRSGLFLLKHIFEKDLMARFEPVLRELKGEHSIEQLLSIIRIFNRYLQMSAKESQTVIMETFKSILEEWGFTEGSPAHLAYLEGLEEGEKKGETRGEKQGRQASRDEACLLMQQAGMSLPAIGKVYGITVEPVEAAIERHRSRLS